MRQITPLLSVLERRDGTPLHSFERLMQDEDVKSKSSSACIFTSVLFAEQGLLTAVKRCVSASLSGLDITQCTDS